MDIEGVLAWLQSTWIATAVAENDILFPWIESVHVLAIVLVVGTISIVDLRLLGVASLDISARRLMRDSAVIMPAALKRHIVGGSIPDSQGLP